MGLLTSQLESQRKYWEEMLQQSEKRSQVTEEEFKSRITALEVKCQDLSEKVALILSFEKFGKI